MSFEMIIGAWVAVGLTLFIFTFLYKDNPLFKLAENLYVGVSVGYTIVKTYDTVIVQLIWRPMVENGEWALLIPVAIGLLMLTRYVPKAAPNAIIRNRMPVRATTLPGPVCSTEKKK